MAIDLSTYVRRYRRFEHHSLKEVLMQWGLPEDWQAQVSLQSVEHVLFDLTAGGLYTPADNQAHQQGTLQGFIVEGGVLWPGVGAIRTRGGHLITQSFFDDTSRDLAVQRGYVKRFPAVECGGAAATLGHLYRNYYHRWADSIPRIYALHHPRLRAMDAITLYIDYRFPEVEQAIIRHLVPENVTVEVVDPAVRVRAARCIHLPFLSSDRVDYSRWFTASAGFIPFECMTWLRREVYAHLDLTPDAPWRKLYVTRRNAKVRRLLNEEEVSAYLAERGYETVALEERPFREQVQLFAEAKEVVAQHGAGLVNLLFAQNVRVLEVCSDADRQIFFRLLSKSRDFPHLQIHRDGADKNDDVVLPLDTLNAELAALHEVV